MSTTAPASRTPHPRRSRLFAGLVVILGAAALALLLRREGPAPPAPEPVAPSTSDRPSAGDPPLPWPGGPELVRTYEIAERARFALELSSGDVLVRPAEGSAVRVEVQLGGRSLPSRFEWTARGDARDRTLKIRSGRKRSFIARLFFGADDDETVLVEGERVRAASGSGSGHVARVLVDLPPEAELTIKTGAGRVDAKDRGADVSVVTGAGDVSLERIAGAVRVKSGAGDVRVGEVAGDLSVRTGAGEIAVAGVLGALDVSTGAGTVRFSGGSTSVKVATGAGAVRGRLDELPGPVEVETGMGGIDLSLAPGLGCLLEASSGLGAVQAQVAGQRQVARRGEALSLEIAGGGPTVRLRTGTGSVTVSDLPSAKRD